MTTEAFPPVTPPVVYLTPSNCLEVYRLQVLRLMRVHPWYRTKVDPNTMELAIPKWLSVMFAKRYLCADIEKMAIEFPHLSEDKQRLAFTPNQAYFERDRTIVLSPGKYLKRHFPNVPDHLIREVTDFVATEGVSIVSTAQEMMAVLDKGPYSCMRNPDVSANHPYEVYDPALGWSMAKRMTPQGTIAGRALLFTDADGHKGFVRTYMKRGEVETHESVVDGKLAAWLQAHGYAKWSSWPEGARMKLIPLSDKLGYSPFVAPYLDGSNQTIAAREGCLVVADDGNFKCESTGGRAESFATERCELCERRVTPDAMQARIGGSLAYVCASCRRDRCVLVHGDRDDEYYMPEEDAICANEGDYYDPDFVSQYLVMCANDEWHDKDDVYFCADDEYRPCDDCVSCEVTDQWFHKDDCTEVLNADEQWVWVSHESHYWTCHNTEKQYATTVPFVFFDGHKVHPSTLDPEEPPPPVDTQTAELFPHHTSAQLFYVEHSGSAIGAWPFPATAPNPRDAEDRPF